MALPHFPFPYFLFLLKDKCSLIFTCTPAPSSHYYSPGCALHLASLTCNYLSSEAKCTGILNKPRELSDLYYPTDHVHVIFVKHLACLCQPRAFTYSIHFEISIPCVPACTPLCIFYHVLLFYLNLNDVLLTLADFEISLTVKSTRVFRHIVNGML